MSDKVERSPIGQPIRTADRGVKDAVHAAVIGAFVGGPVVPGMAVQFVDADTARPCGRAEADGVVDPFLESADDSNANVWIFLLPNRISQLRHVFDFETSSGVNHWENESSSEEDDYYNECEGCY